MPAGEWDRSAVDEDLFNVGTRFEDVAVGHNDVCCFAGANGL